eukprot:481261-Pyramimonas_sp.AAC.1
MAAGTPAGMPNPAVGVNRGAETPFEELAAGAAPPRAAPTPIGGVATPGSTSLASKWLVDTSDETTETRVLNAFTQMCDDHGGPRQYLNAIYSEKASQENLLAYINNHFPLLGSVNYHNEKALRKHSVHDADNS